jgi:hypothetical protein
MVGVEVEVENVYSTPASLKGSVWTVTTDNSLRNTGYEFVSRPIPYTTVGRHLADLYSGGRVWKSSNYGPWQSTHRTGIHVHVDARDYTMDSIKAFIAAYCLVEPALFSFVGEEREECIYCVPWYRAKTDLYKILGAQNLTLKQFLSMDEMMGVHGLCKYGAIYLEPLARFGTIEFRHAPTWTSIETVADWVSFCASLVNYSEGKTASEVLSRWNSGQISFLREALGYSFPVPQDYMERVEKVDADFLALNVAGLSIEESAWQRLEETMPTMPEEINVPPAPDLEFLFAEEEDFYEDEPDEDWED